MDWNNDGKKDLLTGQYTPGNIRIYLNTNTDADPVFDGYSYVKINFTAFDTGSGSAIDLSDWNNDGLVDVLCGNSSGTLWLLINDGTAAAPHFSAKAYVKDGAVNLDIGMWSCPCVVDWNRDGKKDLIIGHSGGTLFYYENIGTDSSPQFNGWEKLKVGSNVIDMGTYSRQYVADWNGDGVQDLIVGGGNGYVWSFEALGPLSLSNNTIPDSTGAVINMTVNAGVAYAGRNYLVLGGLSGTEPGFTLPGGEILPLNWDPFTDLVMILLNSPIFSNFLGTIQPDGTGTAVLTVPANTGYAGLTLYFAGCLGSPFDFVTNGAAIEIVP